MSENRINKRKLRAVVIGAMLALVSAGLGHASLITYNLAGNVTASGDTDVAVGTPVHGVFSFDPSKDLYVAESGDFPNRLSLQHQFSLVVGERSFMGSVTPAMSIYPNGLALNDIPLSGGPILGDTNPAGDGYLSFEGGKVFDDLSQEGWDNAHWEALNGGKAKFGSIFFSSEFGIAQGFDADLDVTMAQAPVPEPATMALMGSGLIALFGLRKKNRLIA